MNWTNKHTNICKSYILATSKAEKDTIFVSLLPILTDLITIVIKKNNKYYLNDDTIQELVIFVYNKLLPSLSIDKVQASQQFIYIGITNYFISYYLNDYAPNRDKFINKLVDVENGYDKPSYQSESQSDMRIEIVCELKRRAKTKKLKEFVEVMIEYLETNNYETAGMKDYVMKKINITYNNLTTNANRLNISILNWGEDKNK